MGTTISSPVSPHTTCGVNDDLDVTRHVKTRSPKDTSFSIFTARSKHNSTAWSGSTSSPSSSPGDDDERKGFAKDPSAFGITGAFSMTVLFPARGDLDFHENPDKFELICILKDPFGLKLFQKFAFDELRYKDGEKNKNLFFCWQECETFRTMPSRDYRLARAKSLYKKYLCGSSGLQIPLALNADGQGAVGGVVNLTDAVNVITKLKAIYEGNMDRKEQERLVRTTFLDPVGNYCFKMLVPVFVDFKATHLYSYFRAKVRSHNSVKPDDFEFLKILGRKDCTERIFLVRKKSTNKKMVMKARRKRQMLRNFHNKERSIHTERLCLLYCGEFPFVTSLHYSLQTKDYAMMVSEYAPKGDLGRFLRNCKGGKAPLEKIFKYGRQIAFALGQLHSIGILHRDLKPSNVVISESGNIKFSDLRSCGVVRPQDYKYNGDTFNAYAIDRSDNRIIYEGVSPSNLNESSLLVLESECLPHPLRRMRRRRSVVGTFGYLAPEVCRSAVYQDFEGYDFSADWFSFGCLLFKLATGRFAFETSAGKPTMMTARRKQDEKLLNSVHFETDVLGGKPVMRCKDVFVLQGDDLEDHFGTGPVSKAEKDEDELREIVQYYREVLSKEVAFGGADGGGGNNSKFWDLVRQLMNTDVEKRLGTGGVEEVLQHEFFQDNDDLMFLADMDEEGTSSSSGGLDISEPGVDRKKMGPPAYTSFKDANASWEATHGFVRESIVNTNPKLKKKTDKEHFDKWDYVSVNSIEEEIAVSKRISKMGVGGAGVMRKVVSESDMIGLSMSLSVGPGNRKERRTYGDSNIFDVSRHSVLDLSRHSALGLSNSMHNNSATQDQSFMKGLQVGSVGRRERRETRLKFAAQENVGEDDIFGEEELNQIGALAMEEVMKM